MDLTTQFGKAVRAAREKLNISQEELASMSGVNRSLFFGLSVLVR